MHHMHTRSNINIKSPRESELHCNCSPNDVMHIKSLPGVMIIKFNWQLYTT